MAGAGYKLFNTGDVLTAAQVNTYLQEQAVMRFANSTARTTALSGVLAEGMMSYLDDTNSVEVYNGSSWVSIGSTGDITGVTAGTGISGGGTSGTVTITNDMATTITAAGDIIVGTGSGTYDNLPIGTTGQVLTADTTVSPYKVKWATASSSPSFVGASAYVTGTQSIANNTIVTVDFAGGEDYDTDNFHSTTTNPSRMTIPSGKGGKYLVTGVLGFDIVPQIYTKILKNGNAISGSSYGYYVILQTGDANAARLHPSFGAVLDLAATDYVQLQVYQASGSAKNLEAGRFDIAFLGA